MDIACLSGPRGVFTGGGGSVIEVKVRSDEVRREKVR